MLKTMHKTYSVLLNDFSKGQKLHQEHQNSEEHQSKKAKEQQLKKFDRHA